jgi:uncharacterized protein with von Willebrand factor type A (vWA) domain
LLEVGDLARAPGPALTDAGTSMLFVGDARCNGLPAWLEDLRRLRRRVHRIGWITPEPRRYWSQASCAMTEYSEIIDYVVIARRGRAGHQGR